MKSRRQIKLIPRIYFSGAHSSKMLSQRVTERKMVTELFYILLFTKSLKSVPIPGLQHTAVWTIHIPAAQQPRAASVCAAPRGRHHAPQLLLHIRGTDGMPRAQHRGRDSICQGSRARTPAQRNLSRVTKLELAGGGGGNGRGSRGKGVQPEAPG